MINKIVKPDQQSITIDLPKNFVHHRLQILVFPVDLEEKSQNDAGIIKFGLGCMKGKIEMAEDFDDPLPDFEDYEYANIGKSQK